MSNKKNKALLWRMFFIFFPITFLASLVCRYIFHLAFSSHKKFDFVNNTTDALVVATIVLIIMIISYFINRNKDDKQQ